MCKRKKIEDWLACRYYGLRRRLGKEAVTEARKARIRAVYPEELPERKARELDGRRLFQALLCLVGFLLLSGAAALSAGSPAVEELVRPEGAGSQRLYRLEAEGEWGTVELEVPVAGREPTPEEKEARFRLAEEELRSQVLGENRSLEEVWRPLDLRAETSAPGILAWWTPQDPELIGPDGTIQAEEIPEEGIATALELSLYWEDGSGQGEERRILVPIRLVSGEWTEAEALAREVERQLQEVDAQAQGEDTLTLPQEIQGKPVVFRMAESKPLPWALGLLGVLAAAALFFREEQQLKEGEERRNRQLLLDYGRLVGNLSVLMGAGLPVRRAWERILRENREKEGRRSLYEEMALTAHAMEQGVSEEQAYGDFGRRCGLPPYLRLGSLLETNCRSGAKGLAALLEREAADAFQERLQLARRQGEEVSSRLLFPMILLFGLVLALLMIPAVLTF